MRIAIIGYSGSGKSTLCRFLGEKYGIPMLHFDTVHFLQNWEVRAAAEKEKIVRDFLDKNENWCIDGNYSKIFFDERMEKADFIVVMLFNRINSLWRVWKRFRMYKGRSRPDMTEGCDEKLDFEFVRWVLFDGRKKESRARYKKVICDYKNKVVVIKNQKQLNNFMERGFGGKDGK